jgi:hypothetical protein
MDELGASSYSMRGINCKIGDWPFFEVGFVVA